MKLGISYNLFDGEELLEGSIGCIRKYVDFVSVVYQTVSNFGNQANTNLVDDLIKMKSKGLIDELYEYIPKIFTGTNNELEKRNIGLQLSKNVGCSHHMSIDADEYYIDKEFEKAKISIIENNYDSSYCQMLTYYKNWKYIVDPPQTYYVPLIYKIKDGATFSIKAKAPGLVDPTRKMSSIINPTVFKRTELQMHHGCFIRNNIRLKLENSSAVVNYRKDIENIINHYNNWQYPQKAMLSTSPIVKLFNIKQLESEIKFREH